MAGCGDVCPVCVPPYTEPEMDRTPGKGNLYACPYFSDDPGISGAGVHSVIHDQRDPDVPVCFCVPSYFFRAELCPDPSYAGGLLGPCISVPSSGIPLELHGACGYWAFA